MGISPPQNGQSEALVNRSAERLSEGVPQESVLSPALFLQYVNDTVNTLPPRVINSLHADDLAAWTSAEHTSTATRHASDHQLSSWADEWCMEINCSKTQATLFSLSTVKKESDAKAGKHVSTRGRQPNPHPGHAFHVENTPGGSCGKI